MTYPVVYALLRRADFHVQLDRMRDAFALVTLASGVGLIPATVLRTSVIVLTGISPPEDFWNMMLETWVSLAMGVLVVTPFLLLLAVWGMRWPRDVHPLRVAEAVALLAGTAAVTFTVTVVSPDRQLLFLVFPLLSWAAWRLRVAGSAPCILIMSVIVVYSMSLHDPPHLVTDYDVVKLAAFVASTSIATLFLAVAVTERDHERDRITNASTELVHALNKLDERLRPGESPLIDPTRQRPRPRQDPENRAPRGQSPRGSTVNDRADDP